MTESPADTSFDRYARMVRRALDVPVALVSLVEADRQVFPGAVGLPEPYQASRETPLSHSFCQYVVLDAAPLVVEDARLDARLLDNPAIPDLGVVAYAGWPLTDHDGTVIGSLCAIDGEPRCWTDAELEGLADLAAACSAEIAQRGLRLLAGDRAAQAGRAEQRTRVLLALSEGLSSTLTIDDVSGAVSLVAREVLGCDTTELWLRSLPDPSAAILPPTFGEQGEEMLLVPDTSVAFVAAEPRTLVTGTPGGDALVEGRLVFFPDRAAEQAAYGAGSRADRPGEGRCYVPLRLGRQVFGVLVLTWPEGRGWGLGERETVENLGAYTAEAVQRALLLQERIDVSLTLQNALLTRLPETGELDIAARYQPAGARDRVGGDWYDAVVMSDGETNVMVGDVVGHDIAAAAKMGTLRHMLRALAWAQPDPPSVIVERLDRAGADLDLDIMASLLYARLEQSDSDRAAGRYQLRWTNAGHLPPVVVAADGTATLLDDGEPDPMLGVLPEEKRVDQSATVEAGSTLLIYTDGLVERRGEDIDRCLGRMRESAGRWGHLPVSDFLDALLRDLVDADPDDDVAVLAVRFPPVPA